MLASPLASNWMVNGAAQLATGATLSSTVTTVVQVELLPFTSVTVRVTVFGPTSAQVKSDISIVVVATPQLSVLPFSISATVMLAIPFISSWMVKGAAQLATGASLSFIITSKLQLAVFPDASVVTNVLVVVPTGKVLPLARPAVWAVVDPGQLSVPTGAVYVITAPQMPASLSCVMFPGQVISGTSVSLTVTSKLQVAVFPDASVTTKVLVVVPTGKVLPLGKPAVWVVAIVVFQLIVTRPFPEFPVASPVVFI
ncbi:hypothetical protein AEQU3_02312 [Aequorivita antarctica]|nr:hypothetical protein AEQU3_02312 [Aequorivita antarctica]